MKQAAVGSVPSVTSHPLLTRRKWLQLLTLLSLIGAIMVIAGDRFWPHSPPNLGQASNAFKASIHARWNAGEVVVLVRHAERCDRSANRCLGPADGITQPGSATAAAVGTSLQSLGLSQTDLLSSPTTRTVQTARQLFGKAVPTQDWLYHCDHSMLSDVLAQKNPQRNLVLVTHSGCISKLESQLGYNNAAGSEYSSALFVAVDANGNARVQGILNPEDWPSSLTKQSL